MGRKLLWVVLLLPTVGLCQGISGSWSLTVDILPTVALDSTSLTINYGFNSWIVGGTAEFFGADGWVWQSFDFSGAIGPVETEWTLLFGPLAPAFLYTLGTARFSLMDTDFTFYTAMIGPAVPGGPSGGAVIKIARELGGITLTSVTGLGAYLRDFSINYTGIGTYEKTYPVDPFPGGLRFIYEELSLTGIPFCCGIALDVSFAFTKEKGFEHLTITAKDLLALCCQIGLDAEVKFTTTGKEISLKPSWNGIEGCFAVYGDVLYTAGKIGGLEIYGFKLRCELADCNYVEFLTAFRPELFYIKDKEILVNPVPVPPTAERLFQGEEFESLKLGFCGPGCCGGTYTVGLTVYFQRTGSLFGMSRLSADMSIPIMANLTFDALFGVKLGGETSLSLGWTFSF